MTIVGYTCESPRGAGGLPPRSASGGCFGQPLPALRGSRVRRPRWPEPGVAPAGPSGCGASAPGVSLPRTLDGALAAFERDNYLVEKLGPRLAKTFVAIKRAELERYRRAVTDWEWNEYATNA